MRVLFHGAAGEVTGSMHLVEAAGKRVLLDCGLCQGSAEMEASNADPFPFDVASIDALVISHAHINHIGRAPLLVKRGDAVVMIARIEGIEVSTAGEALDAGARGALVRVKNSTSGQTLRMRVVAPGAVEPVDMPRAGSAVNR